MSATVLCHVLPSFCNILCSFLDTSAPGLSQQSQAVQLLLLPSISCLMPGLSSHLHGHPLLFPFQAIVVCPMPPCHLTECSAKTSLLHRQAGQQGITCWISPQHCLLGAGHQGTFLREHSLDYLLWPFLFLPFTFYPAKVLHILSPLIIFTFSCFPFLFFHKAFLFFFSD